MSREYLAEYLLQKVRISGSQEEVLNSIPGWEKVGGIIDETPSQPEESPDHLTQQRLFDVTASSLSDDDDHEEELSHKPVEWASPEPTPKAARHGASAVGLGSYREPFDSDRSQSPTRGLSWRFSRRRDLFSPECDQPDANGDKVVSTADADLGVTEAPPRAQKELGSAAVDGIAQDAKLRVPNDWGQRLPESPETVQDQDPPGPRKSAKEESPKLEAGSSNARITTGEGLELRKPSSEAASPHDGRACVDTSRPCLTANANLNGRPERTDSVNSQFVSSRKTSRDESFSSSDSESEKRHDDNFIPPKAVQQKLQNLRKLGAEKAIERRSRKREKRGEEKPLHVPETVMDVVKHMSDGKPAPLVSAADLLSAALRAGITLPPPLCRKYFRGK